MAIKFFEEGGNHMTKCKVIALANQKGGTAKTTTTLNLGIGLAHQGRKVLLVDADPQGDLTTALGWTDADNLPITLDTQMKKILQDEPFVYNEGILHHEEGVDIIPTNIELSGMEISLVNAMSREQTLKLYLSDLKKDYDYILIDCMPSLGMLTINALVAADSVIVTSIFFCISKVYPHVAGNSFPILSRKFGSNSAENMIPDNIIEGKKTT